MKKKTLMLMACIMSVLVVGSSALAYNSITYPFSIPGGGSGEGYIACSYSACSASTEARNHTAKVKLQPKYQNSSGSTITATALVGEAANLAVRSYSPPSGTMVSAKAWFGTKAAGYIVNQTIPAAN